MRCEYWSVGVLSSTMDRAFKALEEIHSTEIAFPSRSVQGDCSPSGNYIRPLLRSFRNILYICIPRCSFQLIMVSRLCYCGAACVARQWCPHVLWRRSRVSVTSYWSIVRLLQVPCCMVTASLLCQCIGHCR